MSNNYVLPEYRIKKKINRPNPSLYKNFIHYPTAAISDAFHKRQTLPKLIKPVWSPVQRTVGSAITVKATLGDQILALKAIELAQPGDIIVITGDSNPINSTWGGVMSRMAKSKGVAALITDGMVRDLEECRNIQFPIWATGVTPIGPRSDIPPSELNLPITMDNVIINPGDLIVADEDGVAVVPQDKIAETEKAVKTRINIEEEWLKDIHATEKMFIIQEVDTILSKRTVEYLD